MPWLLIVLFVGFFVGVLGQFWFAFQVRHALIQRHPDVWLALSDRFNFDPFCQRLAWGRQGRAIGDPDLTYWLDRQRAGQLAVIGVWVLMMAALVTTPTTLLPHGSAASCAGLRPAA